MKQFFCHWRKYVRLTPEAETYLLRGAELRSYRANEQLTINDDQYRSWLYLIQEGLVFGYMEYIDRPYESSTWVATPMESLTKPLNDFESPRINYTLQFAVDTVMLCIPLTHLDNTIRKFPRVRDLVFLLTDLEIERLDRYLEVVQQPTTYHRYAALMEVYPEVARLTPTSFQIDFMAISRSAYYRAKQQYAARHQQNNIDQNNTT